MFCLSLLGTDSLYLLLVSFLKKCCSVNFTWKSSCTSTTAVGSTCSLIPNQRDVALIVSPVEDEVFAGLTLEPPGFAIFLKPSQYVKSKLVK